MFGTWRRIRSRRQSDAEYVEHVRRNFRLRPWMWLTWLVAGFLTAALLGWLATTLMDMAVNLAFPPGNAPVAPIAAGFLVGAGLGMLLGWLAGAFASSAGEMVVLWLYGDRTSELMLKYHDALAALAAEDADASVDSNAETPV